MEQASEVPLIVTKEDFRTFSQMEEDCKSRGCQVEKVWTGHGHNVVHDQGAWPHTVTSVYSVGGALLTDGRALAKVSAWLRTLHSDLSQPAGPAERGTSAGDEG